MMDPSTKQRSSAGSQRQLASLKLISRLLGHELHSQPSAKSITLSRESVTEIQSTLDLFIEDVSSGRSVSMPRGAAAPSVRSVTPS